MGPWGVGTATRTLMGGVTCVLHIKLCPLSPYKLYLLSVV